MPTFARLVLPIVALVLAAGAVGCGDDDVPSEIVLVVDSSLDVPEEIESIRIEAIGPSGMIRDLRVELFGADAIEFPLTLGLVAGGDRLDGVQVTVTGYRMDADWISRTVQTSFVAHERRLLHVVLVPACYNVFCPVDETCVDDGSCVSPVMDAGDMPHLRGRAGAGR